MKSKSEGLFTPEELQRYAIADGEADFESTLKNNGQIPTGGLVTVKSSRSGMKPEKEKGSHKSDKKRGRDRHDRSSKRKRT